MHRCAASVRETRTHERRPKKIRCHFGCRFLFSSFQLQISRWLSSGGFIFPTDRAVDVDSILFNFNYRNMHFHCNRRQTGIIQIPSARIRRVRPLRMVDVWPSLVTGAVKVWLWDRCWAWPPFWRLFLFELFVEEAETPMRISHRNTYWT